MQAHGPACKLMDLHARSWICACILEPFGTFLNFLEPSKTFRNLLKPFGTFYKLLEPSRTFWNLLEHSGNFWKLLEPSGTFWNIPEHSRTGCGTFWNILNAVIRQNFNLSTHTRTDGHNNNVLEEKQTFVSRYKYFSSFLLS